MNKKIRFGEIYGIFNKNDEGYNPFLIIAITKKHTYLIQGSDVKLNIQTNKEVSYFSEKSYKYVIYNDYVYNSDFEQLKENKLKYKTAFRIDSFYIHKEMQDNLRNKRIFLGRINQSKSSEIINLMEEINWKSVWITLCKHFSKLH